MNCNVGGADRAVRIVGGLALAAASYLWLSGAAAGVGYVLAAVALVTGTVRFCPVSALLGINTCRDPAA